MTQATRSNNVTRQVERRIPPPVILATPPANNQAFGAFVAGKATLAPAKPAKQPTAPAIAQPAPVREEHNGRKAYTPGTIGERIWAAANALQAATPNTPVVATAVYLALPDVNKRSVSAGLSHWRKFCGTLHVKTH